MVPDEIGRREFLVGIATGFALATLPTCAWALTTPGDGLITGSLEIPTDGGPMPAYRAIPKGDGPFPTIIVIHEVVGVHEYLQDVCRRFAKLGYYAVAPYLYFREGDVTKIPKMELINWVVKKVRPERVMTDLDSVYQWLGKEKGANQKRVGINGFCWGGAMAWHYCINNPHIKAGVSWYGVLDTEHGGVNGKSAIERAGSLTVPVLGLYGGKDPFISQERIEKMKSTLTAGKSGSEIVIYPDASHGFHADYRPSYNEKAAKDGWDRAITWFKKNGV